MAGAGFPVAFAKPAREREGRGEGLLSCQASSAPGEREEQDGRENAVAPRRPRSQLELVRCRRSPVGVEASVVLVDEELAVEAEVVGVGTEETLGVGRAR